MHFSSLPARGRVGSGVPQRWSGAARSSRSTLARGHASAGPASARRNIACCTVARGHRGHAHAEFPRPAHPAADPDIVLRVGVDLFAAASVAGRSGAGHGRRGARSRSDRADPRAVPARSADPDPVRLLGQGRAVGRFRRVPAHQGAGAQPDRAETAGDDPARLDGDRDRLPDRHSRRHRIGGQERHGVGLRRQSVRAVGHLDAEFLARHHADLPVLDRARLASGLRLCAAVAKTGAPASPPPSCPPSCSATRSPRS